MEDHCTFQDYPFSVNRFHGFEEKEVIDVDMECTGESTASWHDPRHMQRDSNLSRSSSSYFGYL